MIHNVSDIDSMIKASIVYYLKQELPNIDTSANSPTDDLIIKPNIAINRPVLEKINELDLARNLDYAEYVSEDYLDQVIEGNYLIRRLAGRKASTNVLMSIAAFGGEYAVIIPAGVIITSKDYSKRYQVPERLEIKADELPLYLNQEIMQYEIPVYVEALDKGSDYNTEENTLTICETYFNSNFIGVTNPSKVDNGKDKESNKDYAERARRYYMSRHLGTDEGYKEFIKEIFEDATDIFVVGKGSPYMTRDLLNFKNLANETVSRHMGGMTDIYIKGCTYENKSLEVNLKTDKLVLSEEYSKILPDSVSVINTTDGSKTPAILSKTQYTDPVSSTIKMVVALDNSTSQSYDPTIVSKLYVSYSVNLGSELAPNIQEKIDNFEVGKSYVKLDSPVKDIISLEDVFTNSVIPSPQNLYDLVKTGIVGTTREESTMVFKNIGAYNNGHIIKINYSVNDTLNALATVLDMESSRVLSDDVLGYEAEPIYVNIGMKIKMKEGVSLDKAKSLKLQSAVANFLSSASLGSDVNESDIVNEIYDDQDFRQYFDYISLPLYAFYVTNNISAAIEEKRDGTTLAIDRVAYPVLNKFIAIPI